MQNLYTKYKYKHLLILVHQGVLKLRMEFNGRTQKAWFHNSPEKWVRTDLSKHGLLKSQVGSRPLLYRG